MVIDKRNRGRLERLVDKNLSIEERVGSLVETLSAIEPNPDLSRILEEVSQEYSVVKAAYQDLSRDIGSEMFNLLVCINDRKLEAVKIDVELLAKEKEQNRYCSIYSKVPPLNSLKDDADYSYFLSKYQEGTRLSQEISGLNLKVVNLLGIQEKLDDAFAGSMIEVDYLIRRLNETVKTFRYMKTPDLLERYKNNFCAYKDLQSMIEIKNREFQEVLAKNSNLIPKDAVVSHKKDAADLKAAQ